MVLNVFILYKQYNMNRSTEINHNVYVDINCIINFSQKIDYKKNNVDSNEIYRQQFLHLFYLDRFDEDVITVKITEIYNMIIYSKRMTREFDQLLSRGNFIFALNSNDANDNKIMNLKLLFSYDTLDVFIPYLHAMIIYDDENWEKLNKILFNSLLKAMNNIIM